MPLYRLILADDHALFREGLKLVLAQRADVTIAGEASDGLELLSAIKHGPPPDMIILDISMPRLRGIEAIREIKSYNEQIKILILTMHRDERLLCEAFVAGADGYLLKENVTTELFKAMDAVLRGDGHISSLMEKELKGAWMSLFRQQKVVMPDDNLSIREKQVLKMVAEGASNKEIAEKLHISVRTVDHHRASMIEKLHLKSTAELIRYAISKAYIA
jgi:two-component system, NarL family, response regulator NreC